MLSQLQNNSMILHEYLTITLQQTIVCIAPVDDPRHNLINFVHLANVLSRITKIIFPGMSQLDLLYTPSDYDSKLLYQTWQHLIRNDYRYLLESCDDPPPLPNHPMTLTRLINLDSQPPLATPYYSGCNITAQFHSISKTTLVNNLYERLLVLSITLPESEYPDLSPEHIREDRWPATYHYDTNTETGTVIRPRGSIWATHRLKALAIRSIPVLLDSVKLPTPTETLKFRESFNHGITFNEPQHFFSDDFGYLSTNRNTSFQLDNSQDLINTRLDDTLDLVTGNFMPDISTLGRPTRASNSYGDGPRIFPDINHYPYDTVPGARARLHQSPQIPRNARANLDPQHVSVNRSQEQNRLISDLQHNVAPGTVVEEPPTIPQPINGTPVVPASASPISTDPTPSQPGPLAEDGQGLIEATDSSSPPADPSQQAPDTPPQATPEALLNTSESTASGNSTGISSDSNISLGNGVSPHKTMTPPSVGPLAASRAGPILFKPTTGQQEDGQASNAQDNHRVLRSEDKAQLQPPEFYAFVNALTEHYNEDPTKFVGLESALIPLIAQDHVNTRFVIREDLLTNRNVDVIDILMKDYLDKRKPSLFNRANPILKTILKKFIKPA